MTDSDSLTSDWAKRFRELVTDYEKVSAERREDAIEAKETAFWILQIEVAGALAEGMAADDILAFDNAGHILASALREVGPTAEDARAFLSGPL